MRILMLAQFYPPTIAGSSIPSFTAGAVIPRIEQIYRTLLADAPARARRSERQHV